MRKNAGFTLIELLIVITIIAILSAVGFTSYTTFVKNSRDAKRQSDLKFIQSALEQYNGDQKYYPLTVIPGSSISFSTKTYMTKVPNNPTGNPDYLYQAFPNPCDNATTKCTNYCLFAHMENQQGDKIEGNCSLPSQNYNFSLTRP